MVEKRPIDGQDDDKPVNAPVDHPGANIRQIVQRLDKIEEKIAAINPQQPFRLADALTLAMIIIGLVTAIFTASGITARLDDLKSRVSDAERRIDGRIGEVERRFDGRFDKLDNQKQP